MLLIAFWEAECLVLFRVQATKEMKNQYSAALN